MTTADDVIRIASGEVGYVEQGGPDGKSGNLTKYGRWYGLDGQPYCAMGVSWCFFNAGLPLSASTSKGFAYTPSGVAWFQQRGKWTHTPKRGHVVFFDFGGGRVDHVGIVTGVNPDGSIQTIEFNTSPGTSGSQVNGGGCYRRTRSSYIYGYGIPDYTDANTPPTPSPSPTEDEDMLRIVKCNEHPGPLFLTNGLDSVRTLTPEALTHGRNLGVYPKGELAVPHAWISWIDQNQDGHNNPDGA